jgi:hypothetical protein
LLPFFPDDLVYILWGLLMNICTDIAAILFPLQVAFDFEVLLVKFNRGSSNTNYLGFANYFLARFGDEFYNLPYQ